MKERELKVVVATTMHYVRSNHNVQSIPNNKICDEVKKLLPEFSEYVKIKEE